MTPDQLRASLAALGVSQRWLARRLGVAYSTVDRWVAGDLPVPQYARAYVELLALTSRTAADLQRLVEAETQHGRA